MPVGIFGPNKYGLYDMAGNVWEWTSSLYQPYPYDASDGREDLSLFDDRALRGGSWINLDYNVRSAIRSRSGPTSSLSSVGFRCARSLP
jgi:formylglycine-generating enzyme required for sulfatase activity